MTDVAASNLTLHPGSVGRTDRQDLLQQRGCAIWLTGLSGSGKSTIAHALAARLHANGRLAYVLDGDNVRSGLNVDLGFSLEDRVENVRRVGHVAALFVDAGVIVIVAFISPLRADRERARMIVGNDSFLEVFLDTPLELCEARDPKGLYRRARSGEIPDFTGISSPYERPDSADIVVVPEWSVERSVAHSHSELERRSILSGRRSP